MHIPYLTYITNIITSYILIYILILTRFFLFKDIKGEMFIIFKVVDNFHLGRIPDA